MTREKDPEIAVATRTFGNSKHQEGVRVKPGMRFAVGKPQPGMKLITIGRYRELAAKRLLRPLGEQDAAAAPKVQESRVGLPPAKREQGGPSVTVTRPSDTRAAARKRATQEKDPPAPAKVTQPSPAASSNAQNGSQDGKAKASSSSAGAQASDSSPASSRTRRGQTRA